MNSFDGAAVVRPDADVARLQVLVSTLEQLLEVQEQTVLVQAQKLERVLRELEAQSAEQIQLQDELLRVQAATLAVLSTPLIPISDTVMVMPLIGVVDTQRAQQVLATLLHGVAQHSTQTVILDITGVPVVDTAVAEALVQAARAVQLLGAQVMVTGIRPEVAATLVELGADLHSITTRSTLQSGIAAALGRR